MLHFALDTYRTYKTAPKGEKKPLSKTIRPGLPGIVEISVSPFQHFAILLTQLRLKFAVPPLWTLSGLCLLELRDCM